MKKIKKTALLLACVGLLCGCGSSFDASAYIQALLDNSYKNDSTEMVAQKIGTAEEAAELYEQGIEAEVSATISGIEVSEEIESGYAETYKKMFSLVDYTVGEAEKQDDGSYVVTVEYRPLLVFGSAVEYYNTNYETISDELLERMETEDVTDLEIYDALYGCLKAGIDQALESPEYGDTATTTITVSVEDNLWTPSEEDIANLETLLFDMDELNNISS